MLQSPIKHFVYFVTSLSVTALASLPASSAEIEEIIVTASKRGDVSIQDLPISVQAVSGDTLDILGAQGLDDYLRLVTGLSVLQQGPGKSKIDIRGVTTGRVDFTDPQDRAAVALYIDETPVTVNGNNPDFNLYDIERIEVLRGPQGTLFGASSMSGTIRIVTKRPDSTNFSASINGGISHTEHGEANYTTRAAVNIPLAEGLAALRITGAYADFGGYVDNAFTGQEDIGDYRKQDIHASLRVTPNDRLTADLSFFYNDLKQRGDNSFFSDLNDLETFLATEQRYDDDNKIVNLTLNYDLGFADIVSSTSYLDREFERIISYEDLLTLYFGFPAQSQSPGRINNTVEGVAQEVRLSSQGDNRLDWLFGFYYNYQDRFYDQDSITPGFDAFIDNAFFGGAGIYSSRIFGTDFEDSPFEGIHDMQTKEYSFFGEITFGILDNLDFTAGVRYFDWKQDYNLLFTGFANGGPTMVSDETNKEDGFNPRFALAYKHSDALTLYANAAKGFRFGGVNEFVSPVACAAELAARGWTRAPVTFASDELWNYELGAKASWLDNRLAINASGFYIDWDNVQTLNQLPCFFSFKENLGKVESVGFELEVIARPTDNLTLTMATAYTNAESGSDNPSLGATKGARVPYFPEFTINGSAQYQFPVLDKWTGLARFDVAHQGSHFTGFDPERTQLGEQYLKIPAHAIGNLRVGVTSQQWEIFAFVNNLWDERAITYEQGALLHPSYRYVVRPRWAGVNVTLHY